MLPTDDPYDDIAAHWAQALAQRLIFFAGAGRPMPPQLASALEALRAACTDSALLQAFLHACLAETARAIDAHPDLREHRVDLIALRELARAAIDSDCDDRPILARTRALGPLTGAAVWAAQTPARVVWLAAMAGVPDEEGGAATMLVNDMAAFDPALPLRALQAALDA